MSIKHQYQTILDNESLKGIRLQVPEKLTKVEKAKFEDGDTSCGKTSTLMRFVHDKFEPVYKPTIAGEFSLKVGENDI